MKNIQFNNDYDVYRSFLVEDADYEGTIELPKIRTSNTVPYKMIPFSKAVSNSFNDIVDNYAGDAKTFTIKGGDNITRYLYQIKGSLNGKPGVFEWIYEEAKGVTHRRFIPNGKITGKPNQR